MRKQVINVLAKQGQGVVIDSINKTVRDLKNAQYDRAEIKETVREYYFGLDGQVDEHIIKLGY